MFSRRTDLPLDRDALSRFLPWLIAFMVYLAALAQSGLIGLDELARRWDTGMAATLTVQIPSDPDATEAANARVLQSTLNMLSETPGVMRTSVVSEGKVLELLSPWLGEVQAIDVPLPRLIDVETDPEADVDARVLQQKLARTIEGAQVDDHGVWLARLIEMVRTLEALAAGVLALIVSAAMGTVIFTTRTGLTVHAEAIEVLHLTGAQDSYIAKQFAGRAWAMGFKGGLIGLVLAALTLLILGYVASRLQAGILPDLSMPVAGWASLAVLPLAAGLVAGLTARFTVMRTLRRMI
ncbi:cell division protein FtsX [Magnetovibrio sp.]|uniref:cell division protein FtsX n=1 Tax=Magnetovibrio sp. TaxID=2024836 RepID=UPI002F940944